MPLPPLTHHEILGLVEPFTRRGRRVDLDKSDRIERHLFFKSVEHEGKGPLSPAMREDLELENPYARAFQLTRVLTTDSGVKARLVAEGPQPGPLLAQVESIEPLRQFRFGTDFVIAHHHQVEAAEETQGKKDSEDVQAVHLLLVQSVVKTQGLTLTLTMPTVKRRPAELEIVADAGDPIELPEDFLAVLGWDFAPLKRVEAGCWRSKLRLRGEAPKRSRHAEAALEKTAQHLSQTLAEPPRRFHERFVAARWGAAARRMIPVFAALFVVVGAVMLPADAIKARPALLVLLLNAPVVVIGLSMTLQEMARIEIPPLPRASVVPAWRRGD